MAADRLSRFRVPTPWEAAMLDRLAAADFPGREGVAQQVASCTVVTVDRDGSLAIMPSTGAPAAVAKRVPVEAEAMAPDGRALHAELHVLRGMVTELDIYSEDGSPVGEPPEPAEWAVTVLPPFPKGGWAARPEKP